MEEKSKRQKIIFLIRIGLSLTLSLLGLLVFNEAKVGLWINLAIMVVAYLVIAYDIIIEAFKGIFLERHPFDEATLMTVASLGAFALRAFGIDHNEFFEAVLVILLFQVGEFFQDFALEKSKAAIKDSLDMRHSKVFLLEGDKQREVEAEELKKGDIVLISIGSKLAVDCKIIEGECMVNEASLTGESLPVLKTIDSMCYSGTIVTFGSCKAIVIHECKDSASSKLLSLIEESSLKKSKVDKFITKFSRIYTPIVFGIAILLAVVPPLFLGVGNGAIWSEWIFASLSLLVISCPCAVVISVPLAFFAGMGLASSKGVLVKGSMVFEKMSNLKLVCFDKTGTLTEGRYVITQEKYFDISKERFHEFIAAAESRSRHPIAKVVNELGYKFDPNAITSYEEISGYGVRMAYKGHEILAGKRRLLDQNDVMTEPVFSPYSVICFAVDGKYVGYIEASDRIRNSAPKLLRYLRDEKIDTCLLTGDRAEVSIEVSQKLHIAETHYALTPKQKIEELSKKIENTKGMVAFIGDGINDAPSLSLSDIGISLGKTGSDVALESADAVLVNDDLCGVASLRKIARKTINRAKLNIAISLAVKTVVVALAVVGALSSRFDLPLWASVLADSGLAVAMVLSSLALHYTKIK